MKKYSAWARPGRGIIALILIILIILIVIMAIWGAFLLLSPRQGGEEPSLSPGGAGSSTPNTVDMLNGSVYSYFIDGRSLYLTIIESDARLNFSRLYLAVYDLEGDLTYKILVSQGVYGGIEPYYILGIYGDKVYLYRPIHEGTPVFIPLIGFTVITTGGKYSFITVDLDKGSRVNSYELEGGGLNMLGGKWMLSIQLGSRSLNIDIYDLDEGVLWLERSLPLGSSRISRIEPAYSMYMDGVFRLILVGYDANQSMGYLDITHLLIYVDPLAGEAIMEPFHSVVYGAYGSILKSSAYVNGDKYYMFTAIRFITGGEVMHMYRVEARGLSDGELIWDYEEEYIVGSGNGSLSIPGPITYVEEDTFYVSWVFLAAFRGGEKLWMKPMWGTHSRRWVVLTYVDIIGGGISFYEAGGRLYILWMERGTTIGRMLLYEVTDNGVEFKYDLISMGYDEPFLFTYRDSIYIIDVGGDTSRIIKIQ